MNALEAAVANLAELTSVREVVPTPATHRTYVVAGLCSPEAARNLGVVLVGFVAQAVTLDLEIFEVIGTQPRAGGEPWLGNAVESLVGVDNDSDKPANPDKTTERNPWIAEGVVHVLALLGKGYGVNALPPGILAHTPIQVRVKNPGVDMLSLHLDQETELISLCVTETKSSAGYPEARTREAIKFLAAVDQGSHELEIRTHLATLSRYVARELWERLPSMLMTQHDQLCPAVVHFRHTPFDWSTDRDLFGIESGIDRVRLLALPICPWHQFFDEIADAMRDAVNLYTVT